MTLILAVIPVLLLIILMAFFKMSGDKSSIISLIVTMLIALFGFAFSVDNLFYSFLYGALKAVSPILIIILMAIFSYNVLLKTEKMEIIKQQFASISTDKSIQVLLLTWGFGGLLEAMAGFGTAVAIPAAILISLGFKPIFSATVSLIANSVATAFGAIGTPVLVLAKETNLDVLHLSTNVVLQLSVLMFLIPLVLLFLTDSKLKSLPKNIFLALLVGGVSLASQYVAAKYMGAESPAIIGSILSIIVIVIYGKLTASKEEKARKKSSENERYIKCMEHLFTDSVSDYSDQSALSGIASYFREQLDYENQSAYQCVHRQLYYFLADSCRSIAFHRYFYRWIDSGG